MTVDIDPARRERDLYAILGVDPDAPPAEITRAYRRLARRLHPDTNPPGGNGDRFSEATAAYDVLRDPEKRAAYDRARRPGPTGARRRPGGGHTIPVRRIDDRDPGFRRGR